MAKEPGYCHHKPTNQAYVRLDRKPYYLGEYGSEESKERYNRLKAEWLLNRHVGPFLPKSQSGPVVAEVCLAYLDHAESYYANSSEYVNLKLAIGPLNELYARLPASEFGVIQYRACRDWWLSDPKRSRQYVNKQMKRLLRVIKWGVGEGMIPPSVHQALQCVAPLKRGRTDAPETEPVKPVKASLVEATLKALTPVLQDMVRFQQLVGCRPGEVCSIKPSMVDRSQEIWTIALDKHKTAYRGKKRVLYVGPKAQAVLAKYLLRGPDEFCFTPIESERQRLAAKHAARVTAMSCGNRPGTNRIARPPKKAPGSSFATGSYCRSIKYACIRAKLDSWSPNQLRHSAATAIRKQFGLEAAQVILGHSGMEITEVYAEQDIQKALEVARMIG